MSVSYTHQMCIRDRGKELDDVSDEQMHQDILKLTLKYYNVSPNAVDKNAWKELQTSAEKVCSDVANKTPEEAIAYLRAYPRGDKRELNIIADYLVKVKSCLLYTSLVESDSKARAAVVPLSLLHHIPLVAPRGRTLSLIKVVEELIYQ